MTKPQRTHGDLTGIDVHPMADILPAMWRTNAQGSRSMSRDFQGQYEVLRESIRQNGQTHPIVFWRGQLIDGRNRLQACRDLGMEAQRIDLPDDMPEDEVRQFIITSNIHRRDIPKRLRAFYAAKLAEAYSADARKRQHAGKKVTRADANARAGRAVAQAAMEAGVSETYATQMKTILDRGSKGLQGAVLYGGKSLAQAADIAKTVPAAEQVARLLQTSARRGKKPKVPRKKDPTNPIWSAWRQASERDRQDFVDYLDDNFQVLSGDLDEWQAAIHARG